MRITKTFEIEGYDKSFMVNELKVKQIISLMAGDILEDTSLSGMEKIFSEVLLPMCSNVTLEELKDMAPSEIRIIWDNFKEANNSFFELAQKVGLQELLEKIKQSIVEDFGKIAVPSLSLDTQES